MAPNLSDRAHQYELLKRLHRPYEHADQVESDRVTLVNNALNIEYEAWKRTLYRVTRGNLVPFARATKQNATDYFAHEALLDAARYQPQGYEALAVNVGLDPLDRSGLRFESTSLALEFKSTKSWRFPK